MGQGVFERVVDASTPIRKRYSVGRGVGRDAIHSRAGTTCKLRDVREFVAAPANHDDDDDDDD